VTELAEDINHNCFLMLASVAIPRVKPGLKPAKGTYFRLLPSSDFLFTGGDKIAELFKRELHQAFNLRESRQ
jgi:hypothetical protein